MTSASVRPVDAGLFTWPADEPQLIGSRCGSCACTTFPRQQGCPRCTADAMGDALLSRRGTLWTWTTQEFPPKSPPYVNVDFQPYAVGYVELPGECRVEARLVGCAFDELVIGMEMDLTTTELAPGVVTFAFQPVGPPDDR